MERISRILSAGLLAVFMLLFGLALLLGGAQPEHLSYCAAFALAVVGAGAYALWQQRFRPSRTLWERLGSGKSALLLLCFCFLVNLGWVLYFRLEPVRDSRILWDTAVQLAAKEPLSNQSYLALFPHFLGFPAFLSLFLHIFGTGPLVVPVLNVCLTTLSGLFLYRMMLRWRGPNSAVLVLAIWSLFPSRIFYNAMVLSEPYYTCLLLAVLWLTAEVEARRPRLLPAMLLGLLAGLLLRLSESAWPVGAVPILALLLWLLLLRGERGKAARPGWLGYTALLLAAYLLTGPLWNAWAEDRLGEPLASVPGFSLYVGLNAETLGCYSNEDMALLQSLYEEADGNAGQAQREMLRLAGERLRSGLPFGRLFLSKLRNFLGFDEGGAFNSRARLRDRAYQILAMISNIWYYALGILTLWGSWRLLRSGNRKTVLLAPLYIVGLTLAQFFGEVAVRHHYAVIPMLILLAAYSYTRPVKSA